MSVFRFSVLFIVLLSLMACSTAGTVSTTQTFAETQYKALAASQELYNLSWGAFTQLYRTKAVNKDGKLIVDQERYLAGLQFANTYYDAWLTWINAVMAYQQAGGINGTLPAETAMAIAQEAALKLLTLIQPYLVEAQK